MADQKNQQVYPQAHAHVKPRNDEESAASAQSKELSKKKRMKCLIYIAAFIVFQTVIITVFALTVMRVKSPKFRFGTIAIQEMATATTPSPSFNLRFLAQVAVKNTNFGHYKFDNSTVVFRYGGVEVGQVSFLKGRAKARSTRRFNVTVALNSDSLSGNTGNLGSELSSNVLVLKSSGRLTGKVELMKVMKKRKSANMNCTLSFNPATQTVQDLKCK